MGFQLLELTPLSSHYCIFFQSISGGGDKTFIRNKAAQIFALAFITDYPRYWSSFFADLLQCLNFGQPAIDMYLRVLMAIDSEVVDREIVHTDQVCLTQMRTSLFLRFTSCLALCNGNAFKTLDINILICHFYL